MRAAPDRGDHPVQLRPHDRRRDARRLRSADRAAAMRKEGRLDEIAVAAKPGVTDAELVRQIEEILPKGAQVLSGTRRRARTRRRRTSSSPSSAVPARVRRRRALRRLVRHRQLALDHDRAADARARDAADARRVAHAGPGLDLRRRPSSSASSRRSSGSSPASGSAELFALFDAVGFTLPKPGSCSSRARRRRALRRHPRDARREPAPGDPRHARAPVAAVREGATFRRAASRVFRVGAAAPDRGRVRGAARRPLRAAGSTRPGPPLHGRRDAARLPRRRAPVVAARASARARPRLARAAPRRRRRVGSPATTRAGTRSAPPPRPPRS